MANNTVKRVLILYTPTKEYTFDSVDYLRDVLNAAKPYGTVMVSPDDGIVKFMEIKHLSIEKRCVNWLKSPNNVLVVVNPNQTLLDDFTRCRPEPMGRIIPVCFENESPQCSSEWYSLGLSDIAAIKGPHQFKGKGLNKLIAAIRGAK